MRYGRPFRYERRCYLIAAAEYDDNSENYDPAAVIIVKKVAEAIVIHICSSKVSFEHCFAH